MEHVLGNTCKAVNDARKPLANDVFITILTPFNILATKPIVVTADQALAKPNSVSSRMTQIQI